MPLNVTALVPCEAPKFVPVIVIEVPAGPEVGDTLVICGAPLPPVPAGLNAAIAAIQSLVGDKVQVAAIEPAEFCDWSSSA